MRTPLFSIAIAGIMVLLISIAMLYVSIYALPSINEEYFDPVFRSSSASTDWLFFVHPFVLSAALYWFWDHSKDGFKGSPIANAAKASLLYGAVGLVPVLLLTFSAINISVMMVLTWTLYGMVQTFVAFTVFARRVA